MTPHLHPLRSRPASLLTVWGVGLVAALLSSGCVSRLTGNEGNLVFSYAADDDVADFNKPIAVGAKLDISVRTAGTNELVALQSAIVEDPSVLEVVSASGSAMTLAGKGTGNTLISVSAKQPDGTVVDDSVNLGTRVPERLKLHHYCSNDGAAPYLVGNEVLVPYDLEMTNGQAVIGYGYWPIDMEPASAATLNQTNKAQQHLWLKLGDTPGKLTLNSQIDDTTLELDLVAPGAIDDALLDGGAAAKTAFVGTTHFVLIRPQTGGRTICQANTEMTATTTTPDACDVEALTIERKDDGLVNAWGWVQVKGKQVAKCNITVTYPKAADGAGLERSFELDVVALRTP